MRPLGILEVKGGDYVIRHSHLHPNTKLKDLPSGYLRWVAESLVSKEIVNDELEVNVRAYAATEAGREKIVKGQYVPLHVVVSGFKEYRQ